jgi:hypothetical protein
MKVLDSPDRKPHPRARAAGWCGVAAWLLASAGFALTLSAQGSTTQPIPVTVVVMPAAADEAAATFHLTDTDALVPEDIMLGPLVSAAKPDYQIVPDRRKVEVTQTSRPGKVENTGGAKDWIVSILVGHIIPFGESTVPVLVRGETKQTLRFQKPGLIARAPAGTGLEVKQGHPLLIVLENPTTFPYANVRARWRFHQTDVCTASVDSPSGGNPATGATGSCQDPSTWVAFDVGKHAPVTLRVEPAAEWFRDAQTGFPRAARRTGLLSLRYTSEGANPAVFEQSLPLDVQFQPADISTFWNILQIAGWLLVGALVALALRVAVPNYRRKESLKEQLGDAEQATRDILVETGLQVLLKVERLTLDTLRRRSWILGPSFQDIAVRIEKALVGLGRKIEFTRRLDTARGRKATLLNHDIPPTRLDIIDRQLDAACEVLLREKLTEQDWVFAQQRLEAADKLLAEPTSEEKEAFHAFLVQRWKSVRDFFGLNGRKIKVPDALNDLEEAFPDETVLPEVDSDGSDWIHAIGPMRADLQLTALEILRDFLFLASFASPAVKGRLKEMLATPSYTELHAARLLVREISEGVDVDEVVIALQNCEAAIEMTPQAVWANEKQNLTLAFKKSKLDTAAARLAIRCEWTLTPIVPQQKTSKLPLLGRLRQRKVRSPPDTYTAYGWEIYNCFPDTAMDWVVNARFYRNGQPVPKTAGGPTTDRLEYKKEIRLQVYKQDWGNRVERVFPEAIQLFAALLVPLATLAVTQSTEGTTGRWWELIGVGFGSEMIRSILMGKPDQNP